MVVSNRDLFWRRRQRVSAVCAVIRGATRRCARRCVYSLCSSAASGTVHGVHQLMSFFQICRIDTLRDKFAQRLFGFRALILTNIRLRQDELRRRRAIFSNLDRTLLVLCRLGAFLVNEISLAQAALHSARNRASLHRAFEIRDRLIDLSVVGLRAIPAPTTRTCAADKSESLSSNTLRRARNLFAARNTCRACSSRRDSTARCAPLCRDAFSPRRALSARSNFHRLVEFFLRPRREHRRS